MRRRGEYVLDGMANTFRNKHLVARLCDELFPADSDLEPSNHHGHQLVRGVDEIIPFPAWWVSEHITGVAPPAPVLRNLVTVERQWKFLVAEIGHAATLRGSIHF